MTPTQLGEIKRVADTPKTQQIKEALTFTFTEWKKGNIYDEDVSVDLSIAFTEIGKIERERNALLATLEASQARVEAIKWQPIETAPKDGTVIDLWVGGEFSGRRADYFWGMPHHECGESGQYCDSDWHSHKPGWVDGTFQEYLRDTNDEPTHWMPLPNPPVPTHQRETK